MKDGSFAIARLFGIEIRLHPSWLFIFVLVVVQIALIGAPGVEALSVPVRWAIAVAVGLLFFGSVLLHELAHAIVARRRGQTVKSVTLFIFGGAAILEQEAPDPVTEALVAGVGPLTSFVLAGVFVLPWLALRASADELLRAFGVLGFWLAVSNAILGGFNLIPGFPMDGGRILRAVLWQVRGDFVQATATAARLGRAFGWFVIGAGLMIAAFEDVVAGLWLAFIGWFLSQTAQNTYRRVTVERLVEGLHVGDVMLHEYPVASPTLTLDTLAAQAQISGGAFYPVMQDGALAGAIDLAGIRRVPRGQWATKRVGDVMRKVESLVTLTEHDSLWEAVLRFDETRSEGLPVVDPANRRHLVGLVTRDSVFGALRRRGKAAALDRRGGPGADPEDQA